MNVKAIITYDIMLPLHFPVICNKNYSNRTSDSEVVLNTAKRTRI